MFALRLITKPKYHLTIWHPIAGTFSTQRPFPAFPTLPAGMDTATPTFPADRNYSVRAAALVLFPLPASNFIITSVIIAWSSSSYRARYYRTEKWSALAQTMNSYHSCFVASVSVKIQLGSFLDCFTCLISISLLIKFVSLAFL